MKKILSVFLLAFSVAIAHAATLLPNGKQQFFDASGNPLVSGKVYFYTLNTQIPKDTWQDADQTILNTNPVILDGSGEAVIYGSGVYRQVVKDSLDNIIWDQPTQDTSASSINFSSSVGGTANAITVTATGFTNQDGQIIAFVAIADNSGAATLNANGGGALPVLKDTVNGPVALQGNEIKTNNLINAQYLSATNSYHLVGNNLASVTITGGTINGTTIGDTTAATGRFTTVEVTSTTPPASGHGIFVAPGFGTSFSSLGKTNFATSSASSAVNFLSAIGTNTGDNALLQSNGADTNVGITMATKGVGNVIFNGGAGSRAMFHVIDQASAVNYLRVGNATTGNSAYIDAQGSDTNISISITPKGNGVIQCSPCNVNSTTGSANVIIDGSGFIRKTTSSIKAKKEVVTYDRGIEHLMMLRPVWFRSKLPGDNPRRQAGFIAEEVNKTDMKEFVEYNDPKNAETPTGVQYTAMISLLVNSIKDLKYENDNLRRRVLKLERKSR